MIKKIRLYILKKKWTWYDLRFDYCLDRMFRCLDDGDKEESDFWTKRANVYNEKKVVLSNQIMELEVL